MTSRVRASILVVLTGLGALIAQIVWVRELMSVSTAVSHAQSLVLATFMLGLALGSKLGARLSSRVSPALLPSLLFMTALACAGSSHVLHATLWVREHASLGWQLGAACAYLLAATTLMGISLPIVLATVRARHADVLLYALNNLGALVGALFAGYVSIERYGLRASSWVAAGCYACAVLLAVRSDANAAPDPKDQNLEGQGGPQLTKPRALGLAFLCGWIGLLGEVYWMRLTSLVILNTVYAYTQVVAVFLLGILAAALASIGAARRGWNRQRLLSIAFAATGALAVTATYAWVRLSANPFLSERLARGDSWISWLGLAVVLFPPVFASCLAFPLLLSHRPPSIRRARWFGNLSALNTLGSVLGSLACGFWFLPHAGLQACAALLLFTSVLGMALVRRPTLGSLLPVAAAAILLGFFLRLPQDWIERKLPPGWTALEIREGLSSQSMVAQSPAGQRRLWINSAWVAGTGGGHAALGLIPGLYVETPGRALGIAVGTGQTFASALRHGFSRMDCVDIDDNVLDLARRWFADFNHRLFERPGVAAHHDDGRAFLRAAREPYDLIVLEPLQAWMQGTSQLYSVDFYREAFEKLSDGGVLAQWIPLYGQRDEDTRSMVETAMSVFPTASLWLQRIDGILILEKRAAPTALTVLEDRLKRRGLAPDFSELHLGTPQDRRALWIASGTELSDWTYGFPVLTDDRPFLEFSAARDLTQGDPRRTLSGLRPHLGRLDPLAAALREAILDWTALDEADYAAQESLLARKRAEIPSSDLLRYLDRNNVLAYAEALEHRGDSRGVEALFERALSRDPTFGEAMINYGIFLGRTGRTDRALRWIHRAEAIQSSRERARNVLRKIRPGP